MKLRALLSLILFALPAVALARDSECSGDVAALRGLYEVRYLLFRPYTSSYEVSHHIDALLDEMRDPLPNGGYRWVRYVRPSGDAPMVKKEHFAGAEYDQGDRDSFEASAHHPFAVAIVVPRKRSILKANNEVFVGNVEIRYFVDGEEKKIKRSINQWMAPDTMKTIDLGDIADRAEVMVESSARNASKKESLVEVHFRQAVPQDDPENPNYDGIQALQRVQRSADAVTLDYEIARFERRLFPALTSTPFTTLYMRLREADTLLRSAKVEDQDRGKKIITEVSKSLGEK